MPLSPVPRALRRKLATWAFCWGPGRMRPLPFASASGKVLIRDGRERRSLVGGQVRGGCSVCAQADHERNAGWAVVMKPDAYLFQVGKGIGRLVDAEVPELAQCVVDGGRGSEDGAGAETSAG